MLIANVYRKNVPIKEKDEKFIAIIHIIINDNYTGQFSGRQNCCTITIKSIVS